jgi:hypothetical protein
MANAFIIPHRPIQLLLAVLAAGIALGGTSDANAIPATQISLVYPVMGPRISSDKNPQRISDFRELSRVPDTPAVFSSSPPRFVKTLKMLTAQPFFTTLLAMYRL